MDILKQLFQRFFGRRNEHSHAVKPPAHLPKELLASWSRDQQAQADELLPEVKPLALRYLAVRDRLPFTWESGRNECYVDFPGWSAEQEEALWTLGEYLAFKLEIPDAGDFEMRGQGELFRKGNAVWVRFSSVYRDLVGYAPDTGEELFGTALEAAGEERLLFSL